MASVVMWILSSNSQEIIQWLYLWRYGTIPLTRAWANCPSVLDVQMSPAEIRGLNKNKAAERDKGSYHDYQSDLGAQIQVWSNEWSEVILDVSESQMKKERVHSRTVPWLNFSWSINSIMLVWDALHVPWGFQSIQEPWDEPGHKGQGDEFISHLTMNEVIKWEPPIRPWRHLSLEIKPMSCEWPLWSLKCTQTNIYQRLSSLFLFVFSFARALIGPRFICASHHLNLIHQGA